MCISVVLTPQGQPRGTHSCSRALAVIPVHSFEFPFYFSILYISFIYILFLYFYISIFYFISFNFNPKKGDAKKKEG